MTKMNTIKCINALLIKLAVLIFLFLNNVSNANPIILDASKFNLTVTPVVLNDYFSFVETNVNSNCWASSQKPWRHVSWSTPPTGVVGPGQFNGNMTYCKNGWALFNTTLKLDPTKTYEVSYNWFEWGNSNPLPFTNLEFEFIHNGGVDSFTHNQQDTLPGEYIPIGGTYTGLDSVKISYTKFPSYNLGVHGQPFFDTLKFTDVAPEIDVCMIPSDLIPLAFLPTLNIGSSVLWVDEYDVRQNGAQGYPHGDLDLIGDVNGDGISDYISSIGGLVQVLFRNANGSINIDGPSILANSFPLTSGSLMFGFSVSKAGDLNHDGIPDALIGAPDVGYHDGTFDRGGAVVVALLNADGSLHPDSFVMTTGNAGFNTVLKASISSALFGYAIAPFADTTDDGQFNMFAISAPHYDADGDGANAGQGFFLVDLSDLSDVSETWVNTGILTNQGDLIVIPDTSAPDLPPKVIIASAGDDTVSVVRLTPSLTLAGISSFTTPVSHSTDYPNKPFYYLGTEMVVLGDSDDDDNIEIAVAQRVGYPFGAGQPADEGGTILIYELSNGSAVNATLLGSIGHGVGGMGSLLETYSRFGAGGMTVIPDTDGDGIADLAVKSEYDGFLYILHMDIF